MKEVEYPTCIISTITLDNDPFWCFCMSRTFVRLSSLQCSCSVQGMNEGRDNKIECGLPIVKSNEQKDHADAHHKALWKKPKGLWLRVMASGRCVGTKQKTRWGIIFHAVWDRSIEVP